MAPLLRRCLLLALLGLAPASLPALAEPPAAAFEAAPEDLLAQAQERLDARRQAIADGAEPTPVEFLLDRFELHLDQEGRARTVYHQIFVVAERDAVDGWGQVSATWAPWLEERPELSARVIDPSGRVYNLHQDEIAEVGTGEEGALMYSENRSLRAPLPGVRKGAVVEQLLVLQEHRTLIPGSALARRFLASSVPIAQAELLVSYPSASKVIARLVGHDQRPRKRTQDGRTELRWDLGELAAWEAPEAYAGVNQGLPPYLEVATRSSWAELAREYHALVADRFSAQGIEDLVARAKEASGSRAQRIAAIADMVGQQIRYTGLEFAESAIVPYAPADTVRRGYGDCKDQSTLLVVLLEEAGIPARLALLRSGQADDVAPDLPGMDRFNHAIVYLPEDDLWIDPTDPEMRPGLVPPTARGRHALIIDPATRDLVLIPPYQAQDHVYTEQRTLTLRPAQPALWQESVHSTGWFASQDGYEYSRTTREAKTRHLDAYAEGQYGAPTQDHQWSQDLGGDWHFELTLNGESPWYELWGAGTSTWLPARQLLNWLPSPLFAPADADPRELPVVGAPFVASLEQIIDAPPGFGPTSLPEDERRTWGDCTVTVQRRWDADAHRLTARVDLDAGDGIFSQDEVQQARADLADLSWASPEIEIVDLNRAAFDAGRIQEALDGWQALAQAHPDQPLYASQRAGALLDLGLGYAARAEREDLTEAFPDNAYVWFDLGYARLANDDGLQLTGHIDREGAVAAFERVIELDPDLIDAHYNAALALVHAEPGEILVVDHDRLARHIDAWIEAEGEQAVVADSFVVFSLLRLGQYARVRRMVDGGSPSLEVMAHAVAAAMIEGGKDAARSELRKFGLDHGQEASVAQQAVRDLYALRDYKAAGGLLTGLASHMTNPAQASRLGFAIQGIRRHEQILTEDPQPEHAIMRAYAGIMDPGWRHDAPAPGVSTRSYDPPWVWEAIADGMIGQVLSEEMPAELLIDLIFIDPITRSVVKKPAVRLQIGETGRVVYAVREDRDWRMLTMGMELSTQGMLALEALHQGRTKEAQQWATWMRADLGGSAGRIAPHLASLAEVLWADAGLDEEQRVTVLATLAALRATGGRDVQEAPVDLPADISPEVAKAVSVAWVRQLLGSPDSQIGRGMLPEAEHLIELPQAIRLFEIAGQIQQDPSQAEAYLVDNLEQEGEDEAVRIALSEVLMQQGKAREAAEALAPLLPLDDSGWLQHHQAWAWLVAGDLPRAVAAARAALRRGEDSPRALHTAALALALNGEPEQALPLLRQGRREATSDTRDPRWWLVRGALAEAWGLPQHARSAYLRVPSPQDGGSLDDWTVAQARLAALPASAD